jgi:hypothetical protein
MTKKPIDYSKTVIYKIVCNDLTVKDLYVGSTTDFRKRKTRHKSNCNNVNAKEYKYNVYQFIRDHGNWENWTMVLVEKYPCETSLERQKRERYWYEILGATLNKQVPNQTQQESKKQYRIENKKTIYEKQNQKHECDCGGKYTQQNKQRHLNSNKHQKYLQSLN